MEEFTKELNKDNHSSSSDLSTQYNTMMTSSDTMAMVPIGQQPMECSQSSPSPYYSPTDPNSFQNASDFPGRIPSPPRHFFPDSMPPPSPPYTTSTSGGVAARYYGCDRPTRMLRNSACSEGGAIHMNVYNSHEPLSVRNSLILGGERRTETETNFGASAEGRVSLLYEHGNIDDSIPSSWHLIGKGHYGCVYKAQYQGDIVAVNIYSHNYQTVWEMECTLNSVESMAHANIIEFVTKAPESWGAGISQQLVIINRYYPLGSLNQFLRKHVVSLQQASVMISSVANGLAHLHAENYTNSSGIVTEKYAIAHRDMKSTNVYVKEKTGKCVIGDLRAAMILEPSLDVSQLTITKEVGTFCYMAPEVLDSRVHLQDLQSFKQIDVYAFSLIVWEVMSRCCIRDVLSAEDVPCYQLPFEDIAGTRPSLDTMKDIVVARKLRPSLPPMWANDEHLKQLHGVLMKCWDDDPRTRLSAAEVVHQMQEFFKGGCKSAAANVCSANGSGLDMKDLNLNSISGVQNLHSNSMTSVLMDTSSNDPNGSLSGSRDSVVSNLSDELVSKHQLPESSTEC